MPIKKVTSSPTQTPQDYFQQHQSTDLGITPDGTGMQILFKVGNEHYIIGGPRAGALLTVNGGRIENQSASFLQQIAEEFAEETYGVMTIRHDTTNGVQLMVDGQAYPLKVEEAMTAQKYKPGKYAYITYTATCDAFSKAQLQQLASRMTPTAMFWSKLGGYLFSQNNAAYQGSKTEGFSFSDFWQAQMPELNALLAQLTEQCRVLGDNLLVTPQQAFDAETIEAAWDCLRDISSGKALRTAFSHTVGRYSERAGYDVFNSSDVLALVNQTKAFVTGLNGSSVNKVFNDDMVPLVYPSFEANTALVSEGSMFNREQPQASTAAPQPSFM